MPTSVGMSSANRSVSHSAIPRRVQYFARRWRRHLDWRNVKADDTRINDTGPVTLAAAGNEVEPVPMAFSFPRARLRLCAHPVCQPCELPRAAPSSGGPTARP
jgi:hypothetical protein